MDGMDTIHKLHSETIMKKILRDHAAITKDVFSSYAILRSRTFYKDDRLKTLLVHEMSMKSDLITHYFGEDAKLVLVRSTYFDLYQDNGKFCAEMEEDEGLGDILSEYAFNLVLEDDAAQISADNIFNSDLEEVHELLETLFSAAYQNDLLQKSDVFNLYRRRDQQEIKKLYDLQ